jgi:hypothetical protein
MRCGSVQPLSVRTGVVAQLDRTDPAPAPGDAERIFPIRDGLSCGCKIKARIQRQGDQIVGGELDRLRCGQLCAERPVQARRQPEQATELTACPQRRNVGGQGCDARLGGGGMLLFQLQPIDVARIEIALRQRGCMLCRLCHEIAHCSDLLRTHRFVPRHLDFGGHLQNFRSYLLLQAIQLARGQVLACRKRQQVGETEREAAREACTSVALRRKTCDPEARVGQAPRLLEVGATDAKSRVGFPDARVVEQGQRHRFVHVDRGRGIRRRPLTIERRPMIR